MTSRPSAKSILLTALIIGIPLAIALNAAFPPLDKQSSAPEPAAPSKTPEELAKENAEIEAKVNAAIKEAGPQNPPPKTDTFSEQVKERYEVTMTESQAFDEICDAAKEYRTMPATNLQMREEVRAYADYLAPKTGNPGLRGSLAQHGINCLY